MAKLDALGASIEYRQDAFTSADRKTDVETAIVHVKIEQAPQRDILKNLAETKQVEEREHTTSDLVDGDALRGAVRRYEIEAESGLKLIDEYNALNQYLRGILRRMAGTRTRSFSSKWMEILATPDRSLWSVCG
ncbi:hypothetical protein ACFWAD_17305 [Rhodococcus sp. NPDC059969]|uniref:hypothetical protein n=1 Tax=Rhodococcus sp. NPDC059969 TaxID=3347018 RepID=UPI00366E74B3